MPPILAYRDKGSWRSSLAYTLYLCFEKRFYQKYIITTMYNATLYTAVRIVCKFKVYALSLMYQGLAGGEREE